MKELKIEAIIKEMRNGQITCIECDGDLYEVKSISSKKIEPRRIEPNIEPFTKSETPIQESVDIETFPVKDKGELLGRYKTNPIYKNVLDFVKETLSNGKVFTDVKKQMESFFPNMKPSTHEVYFWAHKAYLKNGSVPVQTKLDKIPYDELKGNALFRIGHNTGYTKVYEELKPLLDRDAPKSEMIDLIAKYYPQSKSTSHQVYLGSYKQYHRSLSNPTQIENKSKRKKYKKRKPSDAVGFDKTYGTWIKTDDYINTKRALHKFGFVATVKSIAEEIRQSEQRVRAVLHYMIKEKEIYKKKSKNRTVVYKLLPE